MIGHQLSTSKKAMQCNHVGQSQNIINKSPQIQSLVSFLMFTEEK